MLLDLKQLFVETLGVYLKDFNRAFKSIGHLCKVMLPITCSQPVIKYRGYKVRAFF